MLQKQVDKMTQGNSATETSDKEEPQEKKKCAESDITGQTLLDMNEILEENFTVEQEADLTSPTDIHLCGYLE